MVESMSSTFPPMYLHVADCSESAKSIKEIVGTKNHFFQKVK
jgi:hypothetical protein